jgi:hypothetical protein
MSRNMKYVFSALFLLGGLLVVIGSPEGWQYWLIFIGSAVASIALLVSARRDSERGR